MFSVSTSVERQSYCAGMNKECGSRGMKRGISCASRNFEKAAGHVGIWNRTAVVLEGTLRQQLC